MPKLHEYSGTGKIVGTVKFHHQNGGSLPFFWNEKERVGDVWPMHLLDLAKARVISGAEYEITVKVEVKELPTSKPKKETNPWTKVRY